MLNDSLLPKRLNTTGTSSTKFSDPLEIVPGWSAKRSVPVPEEPNIDLKPKDNLLNNDHFNLLKRYKANLFLPFSPIIPENFCSKKLLHIMIRDDKVLWDLISTLNSGRSLEIHGFHMKNCEKDLNTRDDLLLLDNKIVIPIFQIVNVFLIKKQHTVNPNVAFKKSFFKGKKIITEKMY